LAPIGNACKRKIRKLLFLVLGAHANSKLSQGHLAADEPPRESVYVFSLVKKTSLEVHYNKNTPPNIINPCVFPLLTSGKEMLQLKKYLKFV
jgi:hypothetical protein